MLSTRISRAQVREAIREFDIVHYAGHIDASGLRLADGHLSADDVRDLAGGLPMPRLVFLNGCGSADSDSARVELMRAFVESGAEHCIGPLYDLPDSLGRDYAVAVFKELAGERSIGDALLEARLELSETRGPGPVLWAPYVHYGSPSGSIRLSDRPATPADVEAALSFMPDPVPSSVVTATPTRAYAATHGLSAGVAFPVWLAPAMLVLGLAVVAAIATLGDSDGTPSEHAPSMVAPLAVPELSGDAPRPVDAPLRYRWQALRPTADGPRLAGVREGDLLGPNDALALDLSLPPDTHAYVFRVGSTRLELLPHSRSNDAGPVRSGISGQWSAAGDPGFNTMLIAVRDEAWTEVDDVVAYLNDLLSIQPARPDPSTEWHDQRAPRMVRDYLLRNETRVESLMYEYWPQL